MAGGGPKITAGKPTGPPAAPSMMQKD